MAGGTKEEKAKLLSDSPSLREAQSGNFSKGTINNRSATG